MEAHISHLRDAHRILVFGVSGCGKTSAAQQLGVILKIPVHNVDEEIGFVPAIKPLGEIAPQLSNKLLLKKFANLLDGLSTAPTAVGDRTSSKGATS
ncbi:hypothetical protein GP475_03935 [Corynebacterium poyangense]|uniref:Uncharacterized protein n=1 Tax=Corynebacterium poyangense TaxID=2684405 RepID=A0A7H0SMW4_9CORY|nr:hypothetical protein [Corynebacterium poyangense]MBZ8176279.1 hypothetical protein [Corynebacterium poyangense]QNQ89889.1 hypothetical protein GP475_03935 [Corynebacterium poyangense]